MTRAIAAAALSVVALAGPAARQVPDERLVPQEEMLLTRRSAGAEPRLPMLAGASGVRGPVLFEIGVSPDGRVTHTSLLHGAPMLEQAAADAVRTWQMSPNMRNGRPGGYRTTAVVSFAGQPLSQEDEQRLMHLGDALLLCLEATRRHAFITAEKRCHLASEVADTLTRLDVTLPVRPNRLEAEALVELGHHTSAIRLFERIEARLRQMPFFSLDRTLSLRGLGRAHAALGKRDEALRAYAQAERQVYDAWSGAPRTSLFRSEAAGYYASMADDYARLLEQAGRAADAARVRQRLDSMR